MYTKMNTAKAASAQGPTKVEIVQLISPLWSTDGGLYGWLKIIGRIDCIKAVAALAPVAL
jgi:hypothetical protein